MVTAEEVATVEEANVGVEVLLEGWQNPILPPDHTLTSSGIFLATMRRERYFLSAINLNLARSMWLRYWRSKSLRSPILRTDRTLFGQPRGRKRVPVTVLLARLVAVHNMLLCGVWSDSYWKSI